MRSPQAGERLRVGPGWRGTDDYVFSTSSPHPAPPAHPAPLAAISMLIAAKRPACGKPGNQFGVSPAYRNYCQPATGTASANCRPGTRTKVSSIYRDRTKWGQWGGTGHSFHDSGSRSRLTKEMRL